MQTRFWPIIILCSAVIYPTAVRAQVVEEDDTEILKPLSRVYEPDEFPNLSEAAQRIVSLTNRFREQEQVDAVELNPQLQKAAQYFADYMARTARFGHKADGAAPADRAQKAGYEYCIVAENIAYEFKSAGFTTSDLAQQFFAGWKASPGHRKNMLDADVTETGLAISQGAKNGYFFAVQLFGRPKSKAVEFTIANDAPSTVEYAMGDRTLTLESGHIRTHQVCRPRDLAFHWPYAKGDDQTIQPHNRDYFVVTQDGGRLSLRKK